MHASSPEPADGAARARLVLAISCTGLFLVGVDLTALNIALPAMERDLAASVTGMQWVLDSYNLVLASFMLLAGSTADRFGHRRIFLCGFMLFGGASALCALAPATEYLVAFRALQALGAAALGPPSLALVTRAFPDGERRSRAIGVWTSGYGLGMALGPVLSGALVGSIGWRWVFWVNVPVCLLLAAATCRRVPRSRAEAPRRLDPAGQLLVTAFLVTLTYTVIEGPHQGWDSPAVLTCAVTALVAVAAFAARERRCAAPLIDLRFFRSCPFTGAAVIALCTYAAYGGFLFTSALYLQNVRGLSPLHAGLLMLPVAAMNAVCGPVAGRLESKPGPRPPLVAAGAAIALSGLILALSASSTALAPLLGGFLLIGIGTGLVLPPVLGLAVSGMSRAQAGLAAAIAPTGGRMGYALGVAVIGAVLAAGLHNMTHPGAAAFARAVRPAWWIVAGCGAMVLLLGVLVTTRWAQDTARRTGRLFVEGAEGAEAEDSVAGDGVAGDGAA
ncbi:MFS transporter [Streptomyces klenkii]|uniref:MFS transporter n=1 Tax=Streptomyces klenkii TaxID=1420899 RepID=UPI0036E2D533